MSTVATLKAAALNVRDPFLIQVGMEAVALKTQAPIALQAAKEIIAADDLEEIILIQNRLQQTSITLSNAKAGFDSLYSATLDSKLEQLSIITSVILTAITNASDSLTQGLTLTSLITTLDTASGAVTGITSALPLQVDYLNAANTLNALLQAAVSPNLQNARPELENLAVLLARYAEETTLNDDNANRLVINALLYAIMAGNHLENYTRHVHSSRNFLTSTLKHHAYKLNVRKQLNGVQ